MSTLAEFPITRRWPVKGWLDRGMARPAVQRGLLIPSRD